MGEVPAREVLWNITGHWLIYPCFIAALAPVEDRRARESLR